MKPLIFLCTPAVLSAGVMIAAAHGDAPIAAILASGVAINITVAWVIAWRRFSS